MMPMRTSSLRAAATSSRQQVLASGRCAVRRPVLARAEPEQVSTSAPSTSAPELEPALAAAGSAPSPSAQNFQILNTTTEAINGRAAMMGFVAAVASEAATHQAVFSQLAGRYANLELVEKPVGVSSLGFAMLVALITVGSLAPKMLEGVEVNGKSFGPFTPGLELTLGRVAQLGFFGLLTVEALKGSSLF